MSEDTTNQVEIVEPAPPAGVSEITRPTTGALQRLEAEVAMLDKAFHWAKAMSKTTMVPEHFQQGFKPRGCTDPLGETAAYDLAAAVMYGAEIGLSAMQSAQNVFVVHGKPAVYARTMAAQVRWAGYKIEEVSASDESVVWRGLRDGNWATSEWTMARAQQAGYTSNERYQKNPQEMLRAKAIAEVCRIQYQDVLLGMAYSVEELQLENVTVQRVTRQGVRGMDKLREIAEAATQSEDAAPDDGGSPDGEESSPPSPAAGEPPTPATTEQLDRIRKLYRAKDYTATAMLEDISVFLQLERRLPNIHKLSTTDADAVLKNLTTPEPTPPEPTGEPEQGTFDED